MLDNPTDEALFDLCYNIGDQIVNCYFGKGNTLNTNNVNLCKLFVGYYLVCLLQPEIFL